MQERTPIEVIAWDHSMQIFRTCFLKDTEMHPQDYGVFRYPGVSVFRRRTARLYRDCRADCSAHVLSSAVYFNDSLVPGSLVFQGLGWSVSNLYG